MTIAAPPREKIGLWPECHSKLWHHAGRRGGLMSSPTVGGHMFRSVALGFVLVLGTAMSASAQSADEQAMCKDDAFRICSHTIPDRERTFQCMIQNKDALSPGCRTVMARLLPPDPPPQQKRKPASFSRSASTDPNGEKASTRSRKGGPLNLNPPAAR